MNDILKKSADLAGDMVDSIGWLLKKLESPGRSISREDALGQTAEVSVAIKPGRVGQILLVLGGTLQHYPAKGTNGELSFPKGARVRVADVGNNTVFVEPVNNS
jgi:hypothetical protein